MSEAAADLVIKMCTSLSSPAPATAWPIPVCLIAVSPVLVKYPYSFQSSEENFELIYDPLTSRKKKI